jgi:transcriptional regulator with XRE-family HTH domain
MSVAKKAAIDASAGASAQRVSPTLDRETFGRRLRAARKKFGWTLAEVAERSGVSLPTISRAERGQLALSYEKFSALAHALKLDIGTLFSEAGRPGAQAWGPVVTRAGHGVAYRGLAFTYEFLATGAAGKRMSPILGTVHARRIEGPEDFSRHEGEEWVYVLAGVLEVHFETGDVVRLARGDSLYFDSRIAHAYISTSRQLARIAGACTSESSEMLAAKAGVAQKDARKLVKPAKSKRSLSSKA